MKQLGILLLINVVLVAGYCCFATAVDIKRILGFSSVGFLLGICLIIGDRITGVKVSGVGEVTAAAEQRAVKGAANIEAIERDVESQRNSITMIVRDANKARDDIARIEQYATTAKKKAEEAETASTKAIDSQVTLSRLSDFNLLLTKVNNDDRLAFDQLMTVANTGESPLKEIALQAVINVATNRGLVLDINEADWPRFKFAPTTATLTEYIQFISSGRPDTAASATRKLWAQERFAKRERLDSLIQIIQSTRSIGVLEAACTSLNSEAKVQKNILAWGDYVQWWAANKQKF